MAKPSLLRSLTVATPLVAGGLTLALSSCAPEDDDAAVDAEAWNEASEELASGKADDNSCSGVLTPDRSGFGKQVALTFDDGPNTTTTVQILDILAEHDIQATFFINGNRVTGSAQRAVLQRMIDEGHILANHSQDHKKLSSLGRDAVTSQVGQTHSIVGEFTNPLYFRFPFGASNCETAGIVREDFGLTVTGWNVDSGDWCYAGNGGSCPASTFGGIPSQFRSDMHGWTMHQIRQKNGGIVLFHDIHQFTANTVEGIIEDLEDEGFTFTNIDDQETFPLLNGITLPWVGDECAGDDDCELGAEFPDGFCELTEDPQPGMCSLPCEGACPDRGVMTTFCISLDGENGSCAVQASPANLGCDSYPHLERRAMQRFVGDSGLNPITRDVCVPPQ